MVLVDRAPRSPGAARDLYDLLEMECMRRQRLYAAMTPLSSEPKPVQREKAEFCFLTLQSWAADPRVFVRDMGWVSDPKGDFFSDRLPERLCPRGQVPFLPFSRQMEAVDLWLRALEGRKDLVGAKSRQVAASNLLGMILPVWAWLFRRDTHGILTTYKREYVDIGGKGQRSPVSIFGRIRLFLDSIMWCLPQLKFNQHNAPTGGRGSARAKLIWNNNKTGADEAQDCMMLLTRPAWVVYGVRIFEAAEGNTLKGDMPGESTGRSIVGTYVNFDEIGQAHLLGPDADRAFIESTAQNVRSRIMWGTLQRGGGIGTLHYDLMRGKRSSQLLRWECHWSDLVPYMYDARWRCRSCEPGAKPWDRPAFNDHPVQPGPGPSGRRMRCANCGREQTVVYGDVWSPWFARMCEKMRYDLSAIACELNIDWMSSSGERFFSSWEPSSGVVPVVINGTDLMYGGFDPGYSIANPAAWMCAAFDPRSLLLKIVGYWMAANAFVEYWLPFFKRWKPEDTRDRMIQFGKFAGSTFGEAFSYSREAYAMMERVSRYRLGEKHGDKYGSHSSGTESPYDVLSNWGVNIEYRYTKDREVLCQNGIAWAARMVIDEEIADVKPMSPMNTAYPSLREIFSTAKPVSTPGETRDRLDVSKKAPANVKHAADAWMYLVIPIADEVHSVVDPSGRWDTEPSGEETCLVFGDDVMS